MIMGLHASVFCASFYFYGIYKCSFPSNKMHPSIAVTKQEGKKTLDCTFVQFLRTDIKI